MRRHDNKRGGVTVSRRMWRGYLGLGLLLLGTAGCPQENLLLTGTQSFGSSGGGARLSLVFTQEPNGARVNQVIQPPVLVTINDSLGTPDTAFFGTINIGINVNPTGGNLTGTTSVAPVKGVASFGNLAIDKAGNGYNFIATAAGATSVTSTGFNITP